MDVTYEAICKKLGFTLENPIYERCEYENDHIVNPFSVLSADEKKYVGEYLEKHNNMK
ncbi:MAG: hypothetical protein PUA49_01740 [Butyrivibrio sp.]|nr:hypothetical protein [Butyrivibrio sp.]